MSPQDLASLCLRAGTHLVVQGNLLTGEEVCCLRCGASTSASDWAAAMRLIGKHWSCKGPSVEPAPDPNQGSLF